MDRAACFISEQVEDKIVPLVAKVYTAKKKKKYFCRRTFYFEHDTVRSVRSHTVYLICQALFILWLQIKEYENSSRAFQLKCFTVYMGVCMM